MRKSYLKNIFLIILGAIIAGTTYFGLMTQEVSAANLELSEVQDLAVGFQEEYPEAGKELHAEVTGLQANEYCTFMWKVADTVVAQGEVYRPTFADLEKFITVTVNTTNGRSAQHSIYFSKLPVVYIDTNNVPIVDKENYVKGNMFIQGNDKYNSTNTTLYNGGLEIRGRGNSSWEAPKKPYRVKLSSKADIFGMGASKHWTLLANYYDASLSRNKLSYDFSGELGLAYMESENVILIMNGAYQGVYQFCEHIRIEKTRINITNWEEIAEDAAETISEKEDIDNGELEDYLIENMSWITSKKIDFGGNTYSLDDYEIELPEIDGGYLLELDKNMDETSSFYSSRNQPLMFKSPEYVKTNKDMLQYVKNFVNAFEAAIGAPDGYTTYEGEEVHYTELYDIDALAQYFLVTELFFNTDGMKKSTYMYKDNGEPMQMGPIWDMDWCAGNPYEQASPSDRWQTLFYDDEMVCEQWYRSLIGDPYFAYKVQKLYNSYHTSIESFVAEGGRIDENMAYLKEAGVKNDSKWNSNNTGFEQNTEKLKIWMTQRISWMDERMESVDSLLESWGVFHSNQENDAIISIEEIAAAQDGMKVQVLTESSQEVAVYIDGIKYEEKVPVNKQLEVLIPYGDLKNKDSQEKFVVVRTMHGGQLCTAYSTAEITLPVDPPVEGDQEVTRLFGADRYETGYAVADALKETLGVETFEAVVVATGKNFADALAGSYLAVEKNAPILLTNGKDDNVVQLHAYIKENVAEGGKVYILGGEAAVPTAVEAIEGYDVVRLFGDSRYDTNLAILAEAGVAGDSIIVATGKTFADSLSASAAKLPILLVKPNAALSDAQKEILTGMKNIYIVGGEGAVSAAYAEELAAYGEVTRVYGDSRYDTSVEIAKTFCTDAEKAVVASGKNFPDGLCGGPLAAALNAPLVLTKDGGTAAAAGYMSDNAIASGFVLGGESALSDDAMLEVFGLKNAENVNFFKTVVDMP